MPNETPHSPATPSGLLAASLHHGAFWGPAGGCPRACQSSAPVPSVTPGLSDWQALLTLHVLGRVERDWPVPPITPSPKPPCSPVARVLCRAPKALGSLAPGAPHAAPHAQGTMWRSARSPHGQP